MTLVGGPNNGAVSVGQFIQASDIDAGKFRYLANPNSSGGSYANFTFQVQDNGGTLTVLGTTGIDLDSTPNTETINVLAVNDPPSGSDRSITTLEDSTYIFSRGDFSFTDPLDSPANGFFKLRISSLPTSGSLTLAGVPVTVGQLVI